MYGINTNKRGILFKKGERRGGGCDAITSSWFASKHGVNNASQMYTINFIEFKLEPIDFGTIL